MVRHLRIQALIRVITRRCIDCSTVLKNRSKSTKRCRACHFANKARNAKGRTLPNCSSCSKQLTVKKTKTGMCIPCQRMQPIYVHPMTGKHPAAWNKGLTIFTGPEHRRQHTNAARKGLRQRMSAQELISDRIRTLIRNSLRRVTAKKHTKTADLLGCSTADFAKHLESLFVAGMSWENYGNGIEEWNIDHRQPLITFDLSSPEQQLLAFHYSNCRPLWAIENFRRPRKAAITATVTWGYKH